MPLRALRHGSDELDGRLIVRQVQSASQQPQRVSLHRHPLGRGARRLNSLLCRSGNLGEANAAFNFDRILQAGNLGQGPVGHPARSF